MSKRNSKISAAFLTAIFALISSGCATPETERAAPQNKIAAENKNVGENKNAAVENKEIVNANSPAASAATGATPDATQRQSAIDTYIAGVAKASDGEEYKEARKIVYGDLDADGDEDAVAQFTVEGMGGGNNYGLMLAAFRNENGKFTGITDETVGGKFSRDIELIKIENGKIHLDAKDFKGNDTPLNKTVGGKAVYVLKNNKLTEEKNTGKN